jgi:hypothetical protein
MTLLWQAEWTTTNILVLKGLEQFASICIVVSDRWSTMSMLAATIVFVNLINAIINGVGATVCC